jgi:acetolactate synthase-1/2/3 large subunit
MKSGGGTMADANKKLRTGGQVLVDALIGHDVDTVFCVPGESYLATLDALHDARDAIRIVTCRHENGAAYAGEAYGKITGRPGVTFVTRGPGACNGSIGIHTALQDSTPMVMFVGQIPRGFTDREAFQEIDYRAMFGPIAKWATQIDDPARIPEIVSHAFHVATSGRPGPVVVAIPEDMQVEETEIADVGPYRPARPAPGAADMAGLREMLSAAARPLVLLGGGGWSQRGSDDFKAFAEANGLPVTTSFRTMHLYDNDHPNFVGELGIGANPKLSQMARAADLLLVVGARLGEITTQGYTLFEAPQPKQKLVHVHPDPDEHGRVYRSDLAIVAGADQFAAAARQMTPLTAPVWQDWTGTARDSYVAWNTPAGYPGPLDMGAVMAAIREALPPEGIVTTDAGNFAGWANRYLRFRRFGTLLGPTNGSMGYGMPAAIAAKVARPDAPVICYAGDGGIMMTGNELATAVQQRLGIVTIIVNNGIYGTIRMHQERDYPTRTPATDLANPNFAAWAQAFGAEGQRVETTDAFAPALARALATARSGAPSVIELMLDPDRISPNFTLTALRERALAKQRA